jgi:hypothetical protein
MQIIFGEEVAEEIRLRHVVLELETFVVDGISKTAFCVVPAELLITEMHDIERLCRLHEATIEALKRNDKNTVLDGISHLRGHFGGELNSFYDIIANRIKGQDGN